MGRTLKKLLSLLLAVIMLLSMGIPALAAGDEDIVDLDDAALNAEDGEAGIVLESEPMDPAQLGIPRLGEIGLTAEEIEDVELEDPDTPVRVSIFLTQPSALDAGYPMTGIGTNGAAIAYRNDLLSQQQAVTAAIESATGRPLSVKWNMTLALNAVSAWVRVGDIKTIETVPGVRSVVRENQYEPQTDDAAEPNTANTSQFMVGATAAWANGYTGAGSRIAIIDTGLDTAHQSFNADAFDHAIAEVRQTKAVDLLERSEVSGLAGQLHSRSSNYISTKIPYAYNYVDGNTTVNHTNDTQGEHGSHVAGIAAANRFIKSGSSYNDAASSVHAVGMAPDAQLLIMKVFGNNGGAYDSDYMVAIEDAIVLGCDSVNLSLGSSSQGFTFDNGYQDILNNLASRAHNENMVVTISAGNSYAITAFLETDLYADDVSMHTGGSPGTFVNSLCVAAAQNIGNTGAPLSFPNDHQVFYTDTLGTMTGIAGTYSYVYIDAPGNAADYTAVNSAVSLSGKVVIVNRGDISFVEKGNNAVNVKPKALIVANNAPGTISMGLDDYTGSFPVVSITLADANTIKANSTKHTTGNYTYYTGTMSVTNTVESGQSARREDAEITDFSSWGVPGSLVMKPEITAPGGDIYSVFGTNQLPSGGTSGGTDQYELMSGTSMAAPHMAGLAAVVAQYLRENDLSAVNSALTDAYTVRAINQSLLMSTATPMKNNGLYLSILQQGAGLADVNAATSAASVLMMSSADDTLTAKTGAAADGKVKAELGDDPDRTGVYSYSFSLYNITDTDLTFELATDLFTQATDGTFMLQTTAPLAASVSYVWSAGASAGHDVDKNGVTDDADAQAILDYVSGVNSGAALDLAAADMDGDGAVTSRDAHLLLNWSQGAASGYVVPANGKADVTVSVTLTDKASLETAFPSGAYIQGFTYARCVTVTPEGVSYAHVHSIPVLGFYGSWTDPSMFDNNSYTDALYGSDKIPYTGNTNTNYITVQQNGATVKFSGNPYMVEETFPADRLAINSNSQVRNIYYNLIRAAGTTGFAVSRLDDQGGVDSVLSASVTGNQVDGIWYYQSGGSWQNTGTKFYSVNKTPAGYGLAQGDRFRIGYYAIPEYSAMAATGDYSSASAGAMSLGAFKTAVASPSLGKGAFVGYDFVVDDTDPAIGTATLSGSRLTVSASDNMNLAYVAVLSLDGSVVYAEAAPGADSYSITFDASDAIANARGYVAVFAGDYAGNETARAVKVNDNAYEEKTVYVLTDTLAAGGDYLIVSRNTAGSGVALGHSGSTLAVNSVTVKAADGAVNAPYIDSVDVADTSVWTAAGSVTLKNGNYYLRRNSNTGTTLQAGTSNSYNTWSWDGANNRLSMTISNRSYYLRYSGSSFSLNTAASSVYVFKKTVIRVEVDPYNVSEVRLTSGSTLDLYVRSSADLSAKVLPLTAADRTVTWSSSNSSIASVDASGHVTAVAAGTAVITAAATSDPSKTAQCTVNVVSVNKALRGVIWDEEGGVYFSSFNASTLPTWSTLHSDAKGLPLQSAFMQSSSVLYAATLDTSSASTVLYSVNRNTYALTEYGTNYLYATDMAIGASTYADYVGFAYTFGPYLVGGPIAPGDDGEGGTYSGLPYAVLDCSEITGDAYLAGIACKSRTTTGGTYYVLDENGVIWQTTLDLNSQQNGFDFSTPTKVVETGIGTSFLYQTLYYDGTWLYWGHQTDNIAELIIINPSTGKVYHAGDYGEGVWPATAFYVDGSVAPAETGEEVMDADLPADLAPVATRAEMMTDEIMARFAAEAARFAALMRTVPETPAEFWPEPDPETEPVAPEDPLEPEEVLTDPEEIIVDLEEPSPEDPADDEIVVDLQPEDPGLPDGGNAVPGVPEGARFRRIPLRSVTPGAPDGQTVTVTVAEDEAAANGVIELTFDARYLTFVSASPADDAVYFSCSSDGNGLVRLAYARKTAGDVSFNVVFTDLCDDSQLTVATRERNTALDLDETTRLCRVAVTDHNTGAEVSLGDKAFYTLGETVTFTVDADRACLAVVREADGSYTVLTSDSADSGSYSFTVSGKSAVELVFKGDVNADGRVSTVDVILAKRAAVGSFAPDELALLAGDVNGDKALSTADAALIAKTVVGLQTFDW